jgi:hypothetical protein
MRSPAKAVAESSPLHAPSAPSPKLTDALASNKSQGCDPVPVANKKPTMWPIMFHGFNAGPDIIDCSNVTAVGFYKMSLEGNARLKKTDGTRAKHIKDAFNAVRLPADMDVLNQKDPVQVHATIDVLQDRVIARFAQVYQALGETVPKHVLDFKPFKFNSINDRLKKLEKIKAGTTTQFGNPLTGDEVLNLPTNPNKRQRTK